MLNDTVRWIGDIIFPRRCTVCNCTITEGDKNFICTRCWSEVSFLTPPFCTQCGTPFFLKDGIPEEYHCGRCRKKRPYFDSALSFAVYDGPIKKLLHHYKYYKKIAIADDLFSLVTCFPERIWHHRLDMIIHVPLHRKSLRVRGFDQSFVVAKKISAYFHVPLLYDNIVRVRNTTHQVGLNRKGREKNTIGAFMVKRPFEVKGKNILLVDDVITTGATVNECSKVLKKAGADYISVVTLARTIF